MKIVLIKDVANLGNIGDTKEVKEGYARNYLFTNNLAVLPGDPRISQIIVDKNNIKKELNKDKREIAEKISSISGKTFNFTIKADKKGKLYGSIGPKELAKVTGLKENIFSKHYKQVGEYSEIINLDGQKANIKIVIENEK